MELKFFFAFIAFVYFLNFLIYLQISIAGFFLTLLLVGLWLVLFPPRSFTIFICNLLLPKSDKTKQGDSNISGGMIIIFIINKIHDRFWGFITKYYPFSLLYRDRFFNAQNKGVKTFIDELEAYVQKEHLPLLIESGDGSGLMTRFRAKQMGGKKIKKEEYLRQLLEKLQVKYETIYIRSEAKGFTIQVPTSMVHGQ